MMFGKPAVGCRAGGMTEVIEDGVTGLLAEPGSVPSLVSILSVLLEDAGKRRVFGRAGRERYLRLYTREALIERTLKLYRETLERRTDRHNAATEDRPGRTRVPRFVPAVPAYR
jgi:glycosyltransferase involved in cell wall biosynthesis